MTHAAMIAESLRTCADAEPKCRRCIASVNGKSGFGCARRLKELAAQELERLNAQENIDHH